MNLPELEIYIPTSLFEIIPNLHFKELLVTCLIILIVILFVKQVNKAELDSLIKEFGILFCVINNVLKNSALNKSEFKRISVDLFIFTAISSILSYFVISTELYFKYFKYIVFLWLSLFTCFTIYNNEREVRKSRKFIMYLIETIFMALYFLKIEGTFSTATKGLFLVISLILLFDRILNSYFELKEDVLNGTDPIFCFLYFSESDFNKLKCTIINKIDSDIKDQLNLGMCYLFGSEKVL